MALNRLFVANRGEIALRILRTAKKLGLETVLAVSDADRDSLPAQMADRTVWLGPAAATPKLPKPAPGGAWVVGGRETPPADSDSKPK